MTRWAERAKVAIAQMGSTDKNDESVASILLTVSAVQGEAIPTNRETLTSVLTVPLPDEFEKPTSSFSTIEHTDFWCWPSSPAMNGSEIRTFNSRFNQLKQTGLQTDLAESIADQSVILDRGIDVSNAFLLVNQKIGVIHAAYLRHHWTCKPCCAAGKGYGARCSQGQMLWSQYEDSLANNWDVGGGR